ncbi:MAG: pyridoxamine 5'-phosphate oxidase family protein [Planctomycetota bacterium]|nr:pyridoxamine 5'-phosphate oxidase family protein [Planctomycetota bacterium]
MLNYPAELGAVLDHAWAMLVRGVRDAKHGFHTPTLATLSPEGLPEARIVVLRGADPARLEISAHTDARSPKVHELRTQPTAAWVFYDAHSKLQIRARARAEIITTAAEANIHWAETGVSSRRCYLAPHAPSSVRPALDPNLPESVRGRLPSREESEPGRVNFAVILTRVLALDVLHLAAAGHTRARFTYRDDGTLERSEWLAP